MKRHSVVFSNMLNRFSIVNRFCCGKKDKVMYNLESSAVAESSLPDSASKLTDGVIPMKDATQLVKDTLESNDEVRLVLDIATRARELEARELPRENNVSTDVIAIPLQTQAVV
jgi:hypothetical protein